jgi:hypothetical protein
VRCPVGVSVSCIAIEVRVCSSDSVGIVKAVLWRFQCNRARSRSKGEDIMVVRCPVKRLGIVRRDRSCLLEQWATIQRYAPSSEKDFWSSIPEYDARPANNEAYKKAIYMRYPGSSAKEKWSFWDLENLCRERSRIEIVNAAQFANFDRDFRKIAIALKKASLIEELEMWRWYHNGLDPFFRLRVDRRLEAKNLDRDPAVLFTMDEIFTDATFILKGMSTTSERANTEMRGSSASYKGRPLY